MGVDERLPLNFHQTFVPERRYIAALLNALSEESTLSDQELAQRTGIPMGRSSGKLRATLDYARGMGLVIVTTGSARRIKLSLVGEVLRKEDPYISELLSQLLLHLELTRKDTGAELWYQVFTRAPQVLSREFTPRQLAEFVQKSQDSSNRSVLGPVLRSYEDPASLGLLDVLVKVSENGDRLRIKPVPLVNSYNVLYAYLLTNIWENTESLASESQATVDSLLRETELSSQLNLEERQFADLLLIVQDTGAIAVDRQMAEWIIHKKLTSTRLVNRMFDYL